MKIFRFAFYFGLCLLTGISFTFAHALAPASSPEPILTIHLASNDHDRANTLAFSPDGRLLAVGSSLGIYFFDFQTGQEVRFIPTQTWVRSLAFSPDGETLVTGSYDLLVRLWRVSDGRLLHEFTGHTAWVRSVAYSPDGKLLATASDDNTVRLWSVPDKAPLKTFTLGMDGVRAVAFSPDGQMLATGGYDNSVRLWGVGNGSLLRELVGHTGWVRTLSFSPDGEYLASGGFDATARLWRVSDGMLLETLEGHSASVLGLAFSPDGGTLASASVDTTIRLWQVPGGTLVRTLKGHKDFVFSVAFSSDGLMLASGGVDNTVNLWSLLNQAQSPDTDEATGSLDHAPTSSCKECHHPIGDQPARVIETECTACHLNSSLGLNWCPSLFRASGPTTMSVNPAGIFDQSGVPHGNRIFGVTISSPGNGEHLYSLGDIVAAVPVSGKVYSASGNLTGVQVQLQIQSQGKQTAMLTTIPGTDGSFTFYVNLSETDHEMDLISTTRAQAPNENSCWRCHDKYHVANTRLSEGQYNLTVIATLADGSKAFDERWVIVDHGQFISLQVKTVLVETNRAVPNLPVSASTRLYEWRGRYFSASSDQNGNATVPVETLSHAPTHYMFRVEPVVVDGILYESAEPVEVTLPPGATSAPPITLHIRATKGQLSGQLTSPSAKPVSVSAIHLPDGTSFRTQSSPQGAFTFPELPIGRYLIAADPEALTDLGLVSQPQLVDLFQQPNISVEIPLSPLSGTSLTGVVYHQTGGEPVPFAFVSLDRLAITQAVQPDSGRFILVDLPPEALTLVVSAPGFYSQAHVVNSEPFDLALVMRPETRSLPWGSGQVVLPPETRLIEDGLHLTLEQGWLWGQGESGDEPLRISLEAGEIEIESGRFALERVPGQEAWFYLFDGQAKLRAKGDSQPVVVSGGQMVVLVEGNRPIPVPYDPVVVTALHFEGELPIAQNWQPSLNAQIRDRLARIGISTAQFMTFITYIMAFLALLVLPVLVVYWLIKNRKERKHG
jgi:WD40 repeat protein